MSFKIAGVLHAVFPEQKVSEKFRKREFVIETQDQYPQFIKFQLAQDRCTMIDSYRDGENITVSFDIQGKEFVKGSDTLYFTTLNAWKLEGNATPKGSNGKPMTKVADLPKNDEPFTGDSPLPF